MQCTISESSLQQTHTHTHTRNFERMHVCREGSRWVRVRCCCCVVHFDDVKQAAGHELEGGSSKHTAQTHGPLLPLSLSSLSPPSLPSPPSPPSPPSTSSPLASLSSLPGYVAAPRLSPLPRRRRIVRLRTLAAYLPRAAAHIFRDWCESCSVGFW